MNTPTHLHLTYVVELSPPYTPEALRHDIALGLADSIGTTDWAQTFRVESPWAVSYTRVPGGGTYQLGVVIDIEALGMADGGLARLLTLIFGNAFRHEHVTSTYLTHIACEGPLCDPVLGPAFGFEGIRGRIGSPDGPLIAVPLPLELTSSQTHELVRTLVRNGVQLISHSPFHVPSADSLRTDLAAYSRIAADIDRPFAFFPNLTLNLEAYLKCAEVLAASDDPLLTAGARVCPLSLGLNLVTHLRRASVPLYGYNLLQLGVGARGISIAALTRLLRLAGCDLINVGLHTSTVLAGSEAGEMHAAMTDAAPSLSLVAPVFTGGITPRVAHALVTQFGSDIVLHIKKPILRDGLSDRAVSENITGLREAIERAKAGESIHDAFRRGSGDTRAWRKYEESHGVQ